MKVVIAFVCLAVCTIGGHRIRQSYRRTYIPYGHGYHCPQTPSPTDKSAAARLGVKIPPANCVISWSQFEDKIVGRDWIGVYAIEDEGDLFSDPQFKSKAMWTLNGTDVRRQGIFFLDIKGTPGKCTLVDGQFFRASKKRATLRTRSSTSGNQFAPGDRQDFFVSCDPSRYVILYMCFVTQACGRCSQSNIILMVPDQRPAHPDGDMKRQGDILLNNIPWTQIEADFKRCLDQTFVDSEDPKIKWIWSSKECPHPNSVEAQKFR